MRTNYNVSLRIIPCFAGVAWLISAVIFQNAFLVIAAVITFPLMMRFDKTDK